MPIPQVVADIKTLRDAIIDDWMVCYGKDMVEILTVALRRKIGSKQAQHINSEKIKSGLRLSYHWDDFNKTKLVKYCREWESRNAPYRILHQQ